MTRATFDANVLASGTVGILRSTSTPGELVRRWWAGEFELVISTHLQGEVERTLLKPYFRRQTPVAVRDRLLAALRGLARLVPLTTWVQGVASHPEDDLVLATAVGARVDYLVTGDKQLQRLGSYQGVVILSPRAFLEVLIDRAST